MISKADKHLGMIQQTKLREIESLKDEMCAKDEEITSLKKKLSASNARRDALESQSKDLKSTFQQKIQILIEKAENDDKLIMMLKSEVSRLEGLKGVKSTLTTGKA